MKVYYSTDQHGYLLTPCPVFPNNKVGGHSCANCGYFRHKCRAESYVECKKSQNKL
jgi:hypothetical protein